jgi:hypothetical protein
LPAPREGLAGNGLGLGLARVVARVRTFADALDALGDVGRGLLEVALQRFERLEVAEAASAPTPAPLTPAARLVVVTFVVVVVVIVVIAMTTAFALVADVAVVVVHQVVSCS